MSDTKKYLGGGVYVDIDGERGMLVLTTENGINVTNTIYLEYEVITDLIRYVQSRACIHLASGELKPIN